MATVRSLGLHQPSGLQYAVNELLLPSNPPADSYKWDIFPDDTPDGHFEDELLTTKNTVIWCRGGLFRKSFRFDIEKEPITQALFAYFPASEDDKDDVAGGQKNSRDGASLEKALVVFLKTQAHIYFLAGTSHVVHMPFKVESACAAPIGVIIQRTQQAEKKASNTIKFPRVPPNSFVSSQLTALDSSQQTTFSTENLGNPKPLRFGLGSTLGHAWDAAKEPKESPWPRLIALTDPLLDLGLIVTDPEAKLKGAKIQPSKKPTLLHPAEELLHIERITLPGGESLALAVTIHREANTYTIWRLDYLEHQDPFIQQPKKSSRRSTGRRSFAQSGIAAEVSTPANPKYRESTGATLPGKRQRKSEKVEKPLDLVSSLEQQDKETNGVTRRSSRRVSSMLARADLSTSHEAGAAHGSSRRHDSLGSQAARMSSSHHQIRPSLGSLLEAPLDNGLDEGFHNMALDDHELDGLQQEIKFTKIHSVDWENQHFHYSSADSATQLKPKVFILTAPPFANNDPSRSQFLVGVQDHLDKRLQLIVLHLKLPKPGEKTAKDGKKSQALTVTPGELRVAQNVVDSCKLIDGNQSVILVLSESMDGKHELSIQAPWRELTKVSVSTLFVENTRSLLYEGRQVDRDVKHRKSEVIDMSNGSIVAVRYPRSNGVVDVADNEGRLHQLKIQLLPSQPQVRRVLDACKSVLPDCVGERAHAGWLHVMQWLHDREDSLACTEWSAITILLFAMFLNVGHSNSTTFRTTRLPVRKRRPASGSFGSIRESEDWKALEMGETANSLGCPPWMMNKGWEWALDEDIENSLSSLGDQSSTPKFITKHIGLAKEFLSSSMGDSAFGQAGYLPTALSKEPEVRRKNAKDIFIALHLLLEELKLDIMTPEYVSPGRVDLRVLLCQIARWLGWSQFWSEYELGIQEEVDQRHDNGELGSASGVL